MSMCLKIFKCKHYKFWFSKFVVSDRQNNLAYVQVCLGGNKFDQPLEVK